MAVNWRYGEIPYYDDNGFFVDNKYARWFTDANGREITNYKVNPNLPFYEGDIVLWKGINWDYKILPNGEVIKYPNGEYEDKGIIPIGAEWRDIDSKYGKHLVLGNIYEHPQLLINVVEETYGKECFIDNSILNPNCDCVPRYLGKRDSYYTYVKSHSWSRKKAKVINRDKRQCSCCGKSNEVLHVHHLSYEHFEDENTCELITLCASCHNLLHDFCDKAYLIASRQPMYERMFIHKDNPAWVANFLKPIIFPNERLIFKASYKLERFIRLCSLTIMGHPLVEKTAYGITQLDFEPKNEEYRGLFDCAIRNITRNMR